MTDAPKGTNDGGPGSSITGRSLPRPRPRSASPTPLTDLEGERRRAAVAAAGFTGDAVAARTALSDDEAPVRAAALSALVRLGDLRASEAAAAAADPSPLVRRRLAELAAVPFLPHLGELLDDPDGSVVEAACFGAGEVGDRAAIGRLAVIATTHDDPLCREAAIAALGAIGDEAGLAAVLAGLADRPEIRRRAVVALAAFEGADVTAALTARLTDRDWQVRQAAEEVLALSERGQR